MLQLEMINASYGRIQVLRDIDLHVKKGEVVCILGANGAGKTTLLKTIAGGVTINSGKVLYKGQEITKLPIFKRASLRIAHVPENRRVFKNMTVFDNLLIGGISFLNSTDIKRNVEKIFEYFPKLQERKMQLAGTLSGGEQQMLAIGRGLMMNPELMILDEPSQGLAPLIIEDIFSVLKQLSKTGITILLVEQNIYQALSISNRGYVLKNGKVILQGLAEELLASPDVKEAYIH